MSTIILWFRQDLRLADNPALNWAAAHGAVIPLYIMDTADPWGPGGAGCWWLHHALTALRQDLHKLGLPLVLLRGDPSHLLPELARNTAATAVTWNRCYEPHAIARDTALKSGLRDQGLTVETHNAALLFEPWEVKTQSSTPFKVFTPYYRACLALNRPPQLLSPPRKITAGKAPAGDDLDGWDFLPVRPNWAAGFDWQCGESGGHKQLKNFIADALSEYKTGRDRPDRPGTSRLSPYLHFGHLGPRQIWHAITQAMQDTTAGLHGGGESYLRELIWREFCHHLLYSQPHMPDAPLQKSFAAFPWRKDAKGLHAWRRGQTGYPIVDAGMRQLWQTGWMHNRVRMIVASFLVKDLLIPWQEGERWFWDTLVDADLANNSAGWQWVAGCGADAAPYYRIFNPLLQSQKFDPAGGYIRRYVPELADLPDAYIHAPETAPDNVLKAAKLRLGKDYPLPILNHKAAKTRALEALQESKAEN